MDKLIKFVLGMLVIGTICSLAIGGVNALGAGQSIGGITKCLQGASGTAIYVNTLENTAVFAWSNASNSAWNFANIDMSKIAITDWKNFNANSVGVRTAADYFRFIESRGFVLSDPSAIPTNVITAVQAANMAIIGGSLIKTPMLVLPAGILDQFMPTPDGGYKG